MPVTLVVFIIQIIDPAKALGGFVGQGAVEAVVGRELQEPLEILPEAGGAAGLEGQHIGPMVVFANGQRGAAAIKGVPSDTQRGLGEIGLELRGQSGERFELAVLFDLFILGERGPIRSEEHTSELQSPMY